MKLKRAMAAVLSAAVILGSGTMAFAQEVKEEPKTGDGPVAVSPVPEPLALYTVGVNAVIKELNLDDESAASITVTVEEAKPQDLALKIGKETVVLDTQTGLPVSQKDLKVGQKIYAYHDVIRTKSLPPQANAQAIVVNLDEKKAPAHFLTAESVTVNQDGSVTLLGESGTTLVTIGKDTPIAPLYTKNIVKNTDIRMGTRVFAWYDVVALSMPGQAKAEKVVILPNADRDFDMMKDGKVVGRGKVENGVAMVPLKAAAVALGFEVTWDGKTETVGLDNGKVATSVKLGEDSYYTASSQAIGLTAPVSLGAAAYEAGGVSWAPAELFNLLLGEEGVKLFGGALYL